MTIEKAIRKDKSGNDIIEEKTIDSNRNIKNMTTAITKLDKDGNKVTCK